MVTLEKIHEHSILQILISRTQVWITESSIIKSTLDSSAESDFYRELGWQDWEGCSNRL